MTRTLGDAFVTIRPDMTGFGTSLQRGVDAPARSMSSRLGTIAKRGAIALGAAGAFGAAAFTKNAISLEQDFGRTMSQLQAATNTPAKGMRRLQDLAMKMGAQTTFSASDAGEAMLELARGGLKAATIQGGALQGTMTLAAAGQLEMGEAAQTAVQAMGQFGLKGKDMGKVAAALAGAANASSASVRDISYSLQQAGLAADTVGFSIQETTGILAAFSNQGFQGSDAGTSLKTMLDRLVPQTEKAAGEFKALGLFSKETGSAFVKANGDFKSATQIAGLLQRATEDLSRSEKKKSLSIMFGSDAQRAAIALSNSGAKGIRNMIKATSDQDAAQKMAQANMRGTAGAIETMRGSMETATLAFGQAIKPLTIFAAGVVTEIANGAVPIFQDLGKHLRGLKDVDLSGIGKSMAGIDWSKLGEGVKEMGPGLQQMSASLPGINDLLDVTGVVLKFAADHMDLLAKALPVLAAGFLAYKVAQLAANAAALVSVPVRIAEVVATRQQTAALTALRGAQISGTGAQLASNAAVSTSTTLTWRERVAKLASATASKVVRGATLAWTGVQWALNAALTANPLGLVVVAIAAFVGGIVLAYKKSETFRRIVNAAWNGIKAAALTVWNWFKKNFIPFFTETLPRAFGALIDWVRKNWDVILAVITGPIGVAVLVIHRNWGRITGFFSGALNWLKSTWSNSYAKVKDWITSPIDAAREAVGNILGKIRDAFSSAVTGIGNAWEKLKGAAAAPVNFVINTVYNNGLRSFVNGILDKFPGDLPSLPYVKPIKFARGGVLPGYTPGRDVHHFVNPRTGQRLDLSGGESFMVPEWTKMVGGPQVVARMNKAARSGRMQFAHGGVVWPVPGHETSTYPGHDGIDINRGSGWDDFGDPIRAALSGLISYVGTGRGYGTGIFTKGNYGELVYGHTSRQHVRGGQYVNAGDLIGNVGNTGNSSAPHLHFGFPGGTAAQAMAVLRGAVPTDGAGAGGGLMGFLVDHVVGWLADKGKALLGAVPGANTIPGGMAVGAGNMVINSIRDFIVSKFGGATDGVTGDATPVNANARLGRQMNAARGWGSMWPALNALVMSESGWRNTAQNPTSTAYGIGQFLDSTWAGVGGHKTSDSRLQIQYMLRYIAQRYIDPAGAWAFKQSHNWYGNGLTGGVFRSPTLIGVGERGPERVDVTPLNPARSAGMYATSPGLRQRRVVQMEGRITIDNWRTGEAHFRGIARGEAEEAVELAADFDDHYARGSR